MVINSLYNLLYCRAGVETGKIVKQQVTMVSQNALSDSNLSGSCYSVLSVVHVIDQFLMFVCSIEA